MKRPSVVIDSSVACAWHIPHEKHPVVDDILTELEKGQIRGLAPKLFVFEINNVLQRRMRKFQHDTAKIQEAVSALLDASIELKSYLPPLTPEEAAAPSLASWLEIDIEEVKRVTARVMGLVRKHPKIGFYDAVYLDLAIQEEAHLACLDWKLAEAAMNEKVLLKIPASVYDEWHGRKVEFEKQFGTAQGH